MVNRVAPHRAVVVLAAVELLRESAELTVAWLGVGLGLGSVARVRVGVRLRVRVRARLRLRVGAKVRVAGSYRRRPQRYAAARGRSAALPVT